MADLQRLDELRRRVQRDPASLAFAQLAEECRRAGLHQEAVRVCRAGLAHHPDYLSARVTLGRSLLALGQLDPAAAELSAVLRAAPENLAALRGLAEVSERRGLHAEARDYYRTALALAPHDAELSAALATFEHPTATAGSDHPPATAYPAGGAGSPEPALDTRPRVPAYAATATMATATLPRLERWLAVLEARSSSTSQEKP